MSHRKWLLCLFLATDLFADPLNRARVTQSEGEVVFFGGTAVKTGPKSRAGLEFDDGSVVRVGSNADFSFVPGSRQMSLESGTLLFSSREGTATVVTGPVAVKGANIQMSNVGGRIKAICLSGKAQVSLAGQNTVLKSGDMVDIPSGAKTIPEKSTVNLRTLVSTSVLVNMGRYPGRGAVERTMRMQSPQPKPPPMVNKNDNVPPPPLIASSRAAGAALTTEQIIAQQQAQQQLAALAAQQAADQAAARAQISNARAAQQRAQQQQAAIAQQQAQQKQQQATAVRAVQGNQGQGPQGNQGQGPQGNQGQGNQGQGNQGQGNQGQGNQGQGNQGQNPATPPGQSQGNQGQGQGQGNQGQGGGQGRQ